MKLIYDFNIDLVSQDLSRPNVTIRSTDYDSDIDRVVDVVNNLIKLDIENVENEFSDFYQLPVLKPSITAEELKALIVEGKPNFVDYLGTKERGRYLRIYKPWTMMSTNL
jgi:hypothetical protein